MPLQTRRLLALELMYEGSSRTQAAQIGGVSPQTVRDWVLSFNAHRPDGLLDGKAPGQPSTLSDEYHQRLSEMIETGSIPAVHGVVRWRLADLMQWLWNEYRIRISKQTLSRELRALSFCKLSARPRHHAKSEGRHARADPARAGHPADVHDHRAAEAVLADLRSRYPEVDCLFADMGYQGLADWLSVELG